MASIKDLKKDINFVTEEVVGTCYLHYHTQAGDEKKKQELDQIVDEILDLREEVINKLNNPSETMDKKALKNYYNALINQLLEKVNESFEKLGKM